MKLRDWINYDYEVQDTDAVFKHLDVEVLEDHMLEYHPQNLFTHKNIHSWCVLANGYAVGFNENPAIGWSYPVVKIKKTIVWLDEKSVEPMFNKE